LNDLAASLIESYGVAFKLARKIATFARLRADARTPYGQFHF